MSGNFLWKETRRLLSIYYMEFRGFIWRLPFNKSKVFSIKIFPGTKIKYLRKGDIGELLYKYEFLVERRKSFEYRTLELFSSMVQPGNVVLDIGANTGLYSIFLSRFIGQHGKIFAFEPDAETFQTLSDNLKINSCNNVTTFNLALSDKESIIEMVSESTNDAHLKTGDAFKYIKEVSSNGNSGDKTMKALRLDDIMEIRNGARIDYLKVDVEGAELLVFKGAVETLKKFKPTIIFELNGQLTRRFNYRPIEVLLLLNEIGYELEEYEGQQWLATPRIQ